MLDRRALVRGLGAASLAVLAAPVSAQQYPTRTVVLVVPYPPGGPTDLVGRLVATRLSKLWGKPVVVENRAGASGTIGSDYVARASADGHTLVLGNNASHGAYEMLNPGATPYTTLKDFAPVALVGIAPLVMAVSARVPATDIKQFIAYVKANPGRVNFASAAIGSAPHLASELLNVAAGLDMRHIPFNGTAPALQALTSGTVDVYMGGVSSVAAQVDAGKARLVGAVASQRLSARPDLPTLREQGVDVAYDSWYGLLAPAAVPTAILDQVNADAARVLGGDEVRAEMEKLGFERRLGSRAEFVAMLNGEIDRTRALVRDAKIELK